MITNVLYVVLVIDTEDSSREFHWLAVEALLGT